MPLVSVVIPVHNAGKYIKQCLDSILSQSLTDIEVICVENGSNDDSLKILRGYKAKDSRVQIVVQNDCRGAGHARNEGMTFAKGEYLSFLDADDYFDTKMLEQLYNNAKEHSSDIVICDAYIYNDETEDILEPKWIFKEKYLPEKTVFSYKDIPDTIFQLSAGTAWNKLFLRDFIFRHKLQFQVIHSANDLVFSFMASVKADRISVVNKRLIYYRRNIVSSLSDTIVKWPDGVYESTIELKRKLINAGIYEEVKRSFANFCLFYCSWYLDEMKSWKAFKHLWYEIRNKYLSELDIDGHEREYFYNGSLFDKLEQIKNTDPEEWVYKRYLELSKGIPKYKFPTSMIPKDSKIVIYGAGNVGRSYYSKLLFTRYCSVVLWIDKNWMNIGPPVTDISKITESTYDFVMIAVVNKDNAETINSDLQELGVAADKIVWPF